MHQDLIVKNRLFPNWSTVLLIAGLLLSACQPQVIPLDSQHLADDANPANTEGQFSVSIQQSSNPEATPLPTRPPYQPGELVDYIAQPGDTLPILAINFNTTEEEIRLANPFIPQDATTMPPGMPMKIPIYYAPLWGSPFKILPDSHFVNSPAHQDFDTRAFVAAQPGWLNGFIGYAGGATRSGAELVDLVALNFSVSPRLLLALLEYHAGALTQPTPTPQAEIYTLLHRNPQYRGVNNQLIWTANALNDIFYTRRAGNLRSIVRQDGTLERPDPWQNAATVAMQAYFARMFSTEDYLQAISPDGFYRTYVDLFGDPWEDDQPHIPGSLTQPEFKLPFKTGSTWALTGGPHTAWGTGAPYAALDFAPPSVAGGCLPTSELVTAMAPGFVVRSEPGIVVLDLDGDGDERTGWVIFHLHIATEGRAPVGAILQTGDPIGYPSCEGGRSTGTHVHIARKFNGEWMLAEGMLAFNMEGWVAHNGPRPYLGILTRHGQTVIACECSNAASFITAGER